MSAGMRTIYVKDADLWAAAVKLAEDRNLSMSSLIECALRAYLNPDEVGRKLAAIRAILDQ
jgi:hypothetical protein